ncbi:MAG: hypothetical protein DMG60_14815 [Acidobacteria bacterium]|nr:MAG: hypothetical protein DMG60_14815 [Acidobacteriota bacterium]
MVYLDMKILFMEVYENKELRDRFARADVASHAGTTKIRQFFATAWQDLSPKESAWLRDWEPRHRM